MIKKKFSDVHTLKDQMKGLGVNTLNQNEESVLGKLQKGLGAVIPD
jgi:hypothetical protein